MYHDPAFLRSHVRSLPAIESRRPGSRLSLEERLAIQAGVRDAFRMGWDGPAHVSGLRRIALRALRFVTGLRAVQPFADERLELLRLLAAMARRDDPRMECVAGALNDQGLSPAALAEAVAHACDRR